MIEERIFNLFIVVMGGFAGNFLAYRVTVALLKRDVQQLLENDKDKEARLRVCEKHVTRSEALNCQ